MQHYLKTFNKKLRISLEILLLFYIFYPSIFSFVLDNDCALFIVLSDDIPICYGCSVSC